MIAQAVHDRGVLGEDNGCRRRLQGDVVWSHSMNVVHDEASQSFVPIWCEKPWCTKGKSTTNSWSFPEFDGSVNGLEAVRALRFTQVDGQFADKVASLKTEIVGANVFFHLESSKGVGPEVLYDVPQFDTVIEGFTPQGRANLLRCSAPSEFPPQGKSTKLTMC